MQKKALKKIGIIGAMEIEVELLKKKLKSEVKGGEISVLERAGLTYFEGILEGIPVVIVKSGIGKVNAALCAQRLILEFGVTHVINTGIAGAMASGLEVLDFVVSKDALYHDMDARDFGYKITEIPQMKCSDFKAGKKLIDAATMAFAEMKSASGHKLFVGRIASGDQFISSKETKALIKKNCKPACVEMEGAAIAHACYVNKIPFVIIRCMSDMADESGEKTYSFNEEKAAGMSAKLVQGMLSYI